MEKNDFDQYAKNYNEILTEQLKFYEKDDSYFAEYKVVKLKTLLKSEPKSILDFGCGIGRSTLFLKKHFPQAKIYGCDTSQKCLNEAAKLQPLAEFFLTDALLDKP